MSCCYCSATEGEPELTSTENAQPSIVHPYTGAITISLHLYTSRLYTGHDFLKYSSNNCKKFAAMALVRKYPLSHGRNLQVTCSILKKKPYILFVDYYSLLVPHNLQARQDDCQACPKPHAIHFL